MKLAPQGWAAGVCGCFISSGDQPSVAVPSACTRGQAAALSPVTPRRLQCQTPTGFWQPTQMASAAFEG